MVNITRMRSWNLNVDDLDEAVSFYQQVLGASIEREHTVAGVKVARLNLGDSTIGLFDASQGPRPGVPHHTFEIQGAGPAEVLVRELEAQGISVDNTRAHGDGPGYSIYVSDPSGNRIELSYDPV